MLKRSRDFRTVNRVLGEQPRIGPFPADQVFPWTAIATVVYFICKAMLQASWLVTGLVIAWGWATWWTLTSNKTWLSKFVGVPRISRGYKSFYSLVQQPETPEPSSRKIVRRRK
ncbi:hypothetical protein G7B40_025280 [Aetokthonos hydrillicola Thurmond2011]|jgi:hypothetical protein|uniref:Uncharacterized protein n=1 Tax=Aetokthonos hydrillicola Thurmond2011 TaxID=2712845 RepID=A0AAP5IAC6_9CYAN|nr:hypothetical protein [Aetokthonos hydrillicola]MBO3458429.1 hypothetical protein [Aetokthonos hydrillicola CCALA 1050]MBW4586244.1 hypothetical protein [Aetokthonos hydrillicola CCALA 1050]MDR9897851.1 hypothetical protein [Aetokthonos hydrillicola Thurmond2011]